MADDLTFNVLEHEMVPEHHLLDEEEAQLVLDSLKISKDQLPKIHRSDAAIKVLENIYGPIDEGRIVKIVRKSETAEIAAVYRLVIRG
ncbi:MAG: DNA-directed polymerase subunit [Candidatus Methanomethylophilaceae archaeon]|nr:DNA-directed polymerase subunit [Candidatus Methanomethylophilaceae archaeon]